MISNRRIFPDKKGPRGDPLFPQLASSPPLKTTWDQSYSGQRKTESRSNSINRASHDSLGYASGGWNFSTQSSYLQLPVSDEGAESSWMSDWAWKSARMVFIVSVCHLTMLLILAEISVGLERCFRFPERSFQQAYGDWLVISILRVLLFGSLHARDQFLDFKYTLHFFNMTDAVYAVAKLALFEHHEITSNAGWCLNILYFPSVFCQTVMTVSVIKELISQVDERSPFLSSPSSYGIFSSLRTKNMDQPKFYSPSRGANGPSSAGNRPPIPSRGRKGNTGTSPKLPTGLARPPAKQITLPLPETPPASIPFLPQLAEQVNQQLLMFHCEDPQTGPGWVLMSDSQVSQTFVKYVPLHSCESSAPSSPDGLAYSSSIEDHHPLVRTISLIDFDPQDLNELIFEHRLDWDPFVGIPDGERRLIQHIQALDDQTFMMRIRFEIPSSSFFSPSEYKDFYVVRRYGFDEECGIYYYGQCSVPGFGSTRQKMCEPTIHMSGMVIAPVKGIDQAGASTRRSCVTYFHQMTLTGPIQRSKLDRKCINLGIHFKSLHRLIKSNGRASLSLSSNNPSPNTTAFKYKRTSMDVDQVDTRIYRQFTIQPDHFGADSRTRREIGPQGGSTMFEHDANPGPGLDSTLGIPQPDTSNTSAQPPFISHSTLHIPDQTGTGTGIGSQLGMQPQKPAFIPPPPVVRRVGGGFAPTRLLGTQPNTRRALFFTNTDTSTESAPTPVRAANTINEPASASSTNSTTNPTTSTPATESQQPPGQCGDNSTTVAFQSPSQMQRRLT
eukprot:TRINITY_DN9135_c0_g1_i1.p1 TRINITY_DN9135_c0_g1~~TRINITY_DN9135_c0_g1_i1.p1  ORF type:complete len:783 (+),score=112.39 TRINITY_DN9135_c0_g1_i1:207-2555(+)